MTSPTASGPPSPEGKAIPVGNATYLRQQYFFPRGEGIRKGVKII